MRKEEINKMIGERIKAARKAKGITLAELGKKTGLSESTMQRYEAGERINFPIALLQQIADVLNILVVDFIRPKDNNTVNYCDTFDYPLVSVAISEGTPEPVDETRQLPFLTLPDILMGKYAGNKKIMIMTINEESMNKIIPNGSQIAVLIGLKIDQFKNGDHHFCKGWKLFCKEIR